MRAVNAVISRYAGLALPRCAAHLAPLRGAAAFFATRAQRDAARAPAAALTPAAAAAHFSALFAQLARGLEPMAACNAGFLVATSADPPRLTITTGRSGEEAWELAGDVESGLLTYASRKVGEGAAIKYKRDAATGAWVGAEDGHFLLELLTRDLIHNSPSRGGLHGFPSF